MTTVDQRDGNTDIQTDGRHAHFALRASRAKTVEKRRC